MKASLFAVGLLLASGVAHGQALTKEEYEAFHLKRVAAVNCATQSGGRIILKSSDQGRSYNLLFARKAHEQPRMIVRGARCEDFGPRNWGLHCMNDEKKTLFHLSVTGYYLQKPDGRSYDHNMAFSINRSQIPKKDGMDKKHISYLEVAYSSKCLVQRY